MIFHMLKYKIKFPPIEQFAAFLAALTFMGAIIYYLLNLQLPLIFVTIIGAIGLLYLAKFTSKKIRGDENTSTINFQEKQDGQIKNKKIKIIGTATIFFILFFLIIYFLLAGRTGDSINSPWEKISPWIFPIYFLFILSAQALNTLTSLQKNKSSKQKIIFIISLLLGLTISVALFIYRYGYGFDPFIHQATLEVIDQKGLITPKPFYYLGYYSLVIIIHKILFIPLALVNQFLVPFLAIFFLPSLCWSFLRYQKVNYSFRGKILILSLIFPLSFLIISTPQNLAFIFLLFSVFSGLSRARQSAIPLSMLFALAALAIHPLAGLPALLFAIGLACQDLKFKKPRLIRASFAILSAITLPLAFISAHLANHSSLDFSFARAGQLILAQLENLLPIAKNQESFLLDIAYSWRPLVLWLFIGATFLGWKKYHKKRPELNFSIRLALILVISFVFSAFLSFGFVIDYERSDYANRIITCAVLISSPLALLGLSLIAERINKTKRGIQIIITGTIALGLLSSWYFNYPRQDNYSTARGWSVSSADFSAVRAINKLAQGPYLVLASQTTSAAALNEFGFNRYLKIEGEEFYFYPIPTNSPLYQYFLISVNNGPSKEVMNEAMTKTGVSESWLVVSRSWWASEKIIGEAKELSDYWNKTPDGQIYFFRFKMENSNGK